MELTTVALLRTELDDTTSALSTAELTEKIEAAEDQIALYCNRKDPTGNGAHWLSASRTEDVAGDYKTAMGLVFTPITAVASITIQTSASTSFTVTLTDVTVDNIAVASLSTSRPGHAGIVRYRRGGWPWAGWPCQVMGTVIPVRCGFGDTPITIAYTGGYSAAPPALKRAATELAAIYYRNKTTNPTLQSETLGSYSYTNRSGSDTAADPLANVKSLLEPYVRFPV